MPDSRVYPAISVEEGSRQVAATSIASVATNAAKLALTDILVGKKVKITGEGIRIEEYIGGPINSEASWLVLKNTVRLYFYNTGAIGTGIGLFINGVQQSRLVSVDCGWVDPLNITVSSNNFSRFLSNASNNYTVFNAAGYIVAGETKNFLVWVGFGNTMDPKACALDIVIPPRGTININYTLDIET